MLGWIGNALIICGYAVAARSARASWACIFAGSFLWLLYGVQIFLWNIVFIELVCCLLAFRNWSLSCRE